MSDSDQQQVSRYRWSVLFSLSMCWGGSCIISWSPLLPGNDVETRKRLVSYSMRGILNLATHEITKKEICRSTSISFDYFALIWVKSLQCIHCNSPK